MGSSSSSLGLITTVRNLADRPNAPALDDHQFWKDLFTCAFTRVDLHAVVTADYVRELRLRHPGRLALLLYKCISQVVVFASKTSLEFDRSGHNNSNSSDPAVDTRDDVPTQSVSNALMILIRLAPLVLEEAKLEGSGGSSAAPTHDDRAVNFLKYFFVDRRVMQHDDPTADPKFPVLHLPMERCRLFRGPHDAPSPSHDVSLANVLLHALVSLCFAPGFTIPKWRRVGANHSAAADGQSCCSAAFNVVPELLWESGVGDAGGTRLSAIDGGSVWAFPEALSAAMTSNRRLVVELLLLLQSSALYRRTAVTEHGELFSTYLTRDIPLFGTLAASLINYIASYNPRGRLPYTSHLVTTVEHLVVLSTQLLCVSLDFTPLLRPLPPPPASASKAKSPVAHPSVANVVTAADEEMTERNATCDGTARVHIPPVASSQEKAISGRPSSCDTTLPVMSDDDGEMDEAAMLLDANPHVKQLAENRAWRVLCSMTRAEAQHIVRGLQPLFANITFSQSTFLPASQRRVLEHEELLVLVWKLIDRCPPFRAAFCDAPPLCAPVAGSRRRPLANQLPQWDRLVSLGYLVPLVHYIQSARSDVAKLPAAQIAMYTLLALSCERDFVISCNEPFTEYCPFPLPDMQSKGATYNDFVITAMYAVLQNRQPDVAALHPSAAVVIANIAPFMTSVSMGPAQRLVALLELYGREAFLRENLVKHGEVLMLVLEAVASLLQYQYRGAGHLAFALVRTQRPLRAMLDMFAKGSRVVSAQSEEEPAREDAAAPPTHHHPNAVSISALTKPGESQRVEAHRSSLLLTLHLALDRLNSIVQPLTRSDNVVDIASYLSSKTILAGWLPVPHPITSRRFPPSLATDEWVTQILWSYLYTHSMPESLAFASSVKLFGFAPAM